MKADVYDAVEALSKLEDVAHRAGDVAVLLGMHLYLDALLRLVKNDLAALGVEAPKLH